MSRTNFIIHPYKIHSITNEQMQPRISNQNPDEEAEVLIGDKEKEFLEQDMCMKLQPCKQTQHLRE